MRREISVVSPKRIANFAVSASLWRVAGGEEVARAAEEGSLTEGFEVLDSCHKSVCLLKWV